MLVVKVLIIRGKNLDLGIFSSEEALSQLQTGILRPGSLVVLNVSLMRSLFCFHFCVFSCFHFSSFLV